MHTGLIYVWFKKYVHYVWIKNINVKIVVKENIFSVVIIHQTTFAYGCFRKEIMIALYCVTTSTGMISYPIFQYLYRSAIMPTIVPNGAKVMSLTVENCKIKMIDSINFLPMALAKLPDMFGFKELKKGYFPHLFNKKENQCVVLESLPELVCYNPDSMKPEDRDQF